MKEMLVRAAATAKSHVIMTQDWVARRRHVAQSGQSLVEYALILAFVALVVIVAMQALQPAVSGTFNHVTTCLNSANDTSTITGTTTRC